MRQTDLERNGIFIFTEPAWERKLPRHVDRVRTSLLDFTWTTLDRLNDHRKILSMDDKALRKSGFNAAARDALNRYKSIAAYARNHHHGKDREAEWATFFLLNFFRPLVAAAEIKDEDTRQ